MLVQINAMRTFYVFLEIFVVFLTLTESARCDSSEEPVDLEWVED